MERRTEPGYEYHSCDFMDDGVYIDMNLLRDYEDTDLTPEQIMELAERNTPKEAIYDIYGDQGDGADPDVWICPNCEAVYDIDDDYDFCPNCGQRLKKEERQ